MKTSRKSVSRVIGYLLSATCLVILALLTDWRAFVKALSSASATALAVAPLFVVLTYVFFGLRWSLLLRVDQKRFGPLLAILLMGYGANAMLPLRAGDALRVVLVHKVLGGAFGSTVSSIVIERLTDLLTLLVLGACVALVVNLPAPIVAIMRACAAIAIVLAICIIAVAIFGEKASVLAGRLARKLGFRAVDGIVAQVRQFAEAAHAMLQRDRESLKRLAGVLGFSVLGWGSFAAAVAVCVHAFDITPALAPGLLLAVVTNLGAVIPASPGSFGVYHALGVLALAPWSVPFELALSVATVSHAIAVAMQLGLGFLAMSMLQRFATLPRSVWSGKVSE